MQTTLSHQPLNPAQIHFLQTLQFVKTDKMMMELQQVVSDFFFKKWKKRHTSGHRKTTSKQQVFSVFFFN